MNEVAFSEFSFGFSFLHELALLWKDRLVGSPKLPSLIEEGQPGGGYDAALEMPGFVYFVQFKIPTYLRSARAKEASEHGWPFPYYRFSIYSDPPSKQHEYLLDHEGQGGKVEYASPRFHLPDALKQHFDAGTVRSNSLCIRPSDIGRLDLSTPHSIVYLPDRDSKVGVCSDFREIREYGLGPADENGFTSAAPASRLASTGAPTDVQAQNLGLQVQTHTNLLRFQRNGAISRIEDEYGDDDVGRLRAYSRVRLGAEVLVVRDDPAESDVRT